MKFNVRPFITVISVFCLALYVILTIRSHTASGWMLMLGLAFLSIRLYYSETLRGFSFTIAIIGAAALAMYYPHYFHRVGSFQLSTLIIPLLQLIMFGMGAALSWKDFARVLKMPKGVIIGLFCQFSIMPLVGFSITLLFDLPMEVEAGIILVGSCPSGLSSNVMAYLANANLALSVTLTAVATLLAPVITPFYMKVLAGELVHVDFLSMMWEMTKVVILPVLAGVLFNHYFHGRAWWIERLLVFLSMAGIAVIILVIVAAGRESLLMIGPLLVLAVFIHNVVGYFLGYLMAKTFRMSEADSRTIAFEVGLQNGGLASGLAMTMGKMTTMGLAPVVFAPLMNITGSTLAMWWRKRS